MVQQVLRLTNAITHVSRQIGETSMMKIKKSTFLSLAISLASLFISTQSFADEVRHGLASYYSDRFHGRKTASGEIFNMYKLTAASNRYKFGTKLKVTCTTTNKSVVVRVNDTGAFTRKYGREIDLSYATAKAIGMLDRGVTRVKIEELK